MHPTCRVTGPPLKNPHGGSLSASGLVLTGAHNGLPFIRATIQAASIVFRFGTTFPVMDDPSIWTHMVYTSSTSISHT